MWNFDKIQPIRRKRHGRDSCGLMWNFDKIQLAIASRLQEYSCGLMWNFDKIQQAGGTSRSSGVVV